MMTIDIEEWFTSSNLESVIDRSSWDRQESRVYHSTERILELLAEYGTSATFFVLGWVAERHPGLVRRISDAGHEIASHGTAHESVYSLSSSQFREDITRAKNTLEHLTGGAVLGYRAPNFSITDWAIDILQDVDFTYDSSAFPTLTHDRYGSLAQMDARAPIQEIRPGFHEVSIACLALGRRGLPWGGGGYFRLLPYPLFRTGVTRIMNKSSCVFYIHNWEIDPNQPRVAGLTFSRKLRHTLHLERVEARLRRLLQDFRWTSISAYLQQARLESPRPLPGNYTAVPSSADVP